MHEEQIVYKTRFKKFDLWLLFALYALCIGISGLRHEPWGDELQTWNLIKGSQSVFTLFFNSRYDGHPPFWYLILFSFSKITHSLGIIQFVAFLISCLTAFVFIFYIKLPLSVKILTLSGYYFLFEYSLFSRNYSLVVLIELLLCVIIQRDFKYKMFLYYILLFLLTNTHFLALFLAVSFHLLILLWFYEKKAKLSFILIHLIVGTILLMTGFIFVYTVPDLSSGLNDKFSDWHKGQLMLAFQLPLRAFIPIPAFWEDHFWNTNAIWELCKDNFLLRALALMISATTVVLSVLVLRKHRNALLFFGFNTFLMFILAAVFPISNARYVGFVFLGFLISLCLFWEELNLNRLGKGVIYLLLTFQIFGALVALPRDWTQAFSQIHKVKNVLSRIPSTQDLITDYWGLNFLNAITNKEYYCVESQKKESFLVLNSSNINKLKNRHRYTEGSKYYFDQKGVRSVYFLCNTAPQQLNELDSNLNKTFFVKLILAETGSIEKFSDLYLYELSLRTKH